MATTKPGKSVSTSQKGAERQSLLQQPSDEKDDDAIGATTSVVEYDNPMNKHNQNLRRHLRNIGHKLCQHCIREPCYHSLRQVGYDGNKNAVFYMCLGQDNVKSKTSVNPMNYVRDLTQHMQAMCQSVRSIDENIGVIWIIDMQGWWGSAVHTPENLCLMKPLCKIVKVFVLNARTEWKEDWQTFKDKSSHDNANRDLLNNLTCLSMVDFKFKLHGELKNQELFNWIADEIRCNNEPQQQFLCVTEEHDSRASPQYIENVVEPFFSKLTNNVPHPSIVQAFLDKEDAKEKTMSANMTIVGDRNEKKDSLGYEDYANELVDLLMESSVPTGITVGIYGNWGKGKTFLLDQLSKKIEDRRKEILPKPIRWQKSWDKRGGCCPIPYFVYLILLIVLFMAITVGALVVIFIIVLRDIQNITSTDNNTLITTTAMPLSPIPAYTLVGAASLILIIILLAALCMCSCVCSSRYFSELLKLIVLVLCKRPPHPDSIRTNHPPDLDMIEVRFNAWEYAGSDFLWAAIVTNLCNAVEKQFGYWKMRMFRVVEADVGEGIQDMMESQAKRLDKNPSFHFCEQLNKYYVPLEERPALCGFTSTFIFWLSLVAFVIVSIVTIIAYSFVLNTFDEAIILQAVSGGVLTTVFLSRIKSSVSLIKSLFQSQAERISSLQKQMTGPNFDEQLGFMHRVRMEVFLVQYLVRYMECLYQKKFRMMLIIDDLDRVEKRKILKILEAINILLSDSFSPFISVIAIDPRIVVKAVEQSFSKVLLDANINGHEYLKKIVQLPFCVPDVDDDRVVGFLQDKVEIIKRICSKHINDNKSSRDLQVQQDQTVNNVETPIESSDGSIPLQPMNVKVSAAPTGVSTVPVTVDGNVIKDNAVIIALEAYQEEPELLFSNPRNMTRICNILMLTMKLLGRKKQNREIKDIRNMAWWVLLTEQWPYRLSWLIQIYEDECQLATIHGSRVNEDQYLLDVYERNEGKLSRPTDWKSLLSLDYDPELFRRFLQRHPFTLGDLSKNLPFTVNLDLSLKTTIACTLAEDQISQKDKISRWLNGPA